MICCVVVDYGKFSFCLFYFFFLLNQGSREKVEIIGIEGYSRIKKKKKLCEMKMKIEKVFENLEKKNCFKNKKTAIFPRNRNF